MKYTKTLATTLIASGLLLCAAGCEEKGPMEKAGESIDNAAKDVKDAFDKDGPVENAAEKAGEAIDDAADKVKDAVEDATDGK